MANPITDLNAKPQQYYEQTRSEMLAYIPAGARTTLDIGCACGGFSALLKERLGAECWGVEIDEDAARIAETRLDKVLRGDAGQCLEQLPDDYFDCIICNDIIEHLVDPWTLLRNLRSKLTPAGVVVACVPNVRYCRVLFDIVVRGNWDYRDKGILDKTHLRFFTYRSLRKMFPPLGYELVRLEGLEPDPTLPARLVKLFCLLFFNAFVDIRFHHIVCVARPTVQESP